MTLRKFDTQSMSHLADLLICIQGQIVEYTRHLTRLCGEFLESERGDDHKTRRKSHMTRKQFFGFIASIPQLGL